MPAPSSVPGGATDPERASLALFLDRQRESLIGKLKDLSEEQARSIPTVSELSLLSIVKHSAVWERRWFQIILAGRRFPGEWPEVEENEESDTTFELAPADTVDSVVAEYREQIAGSQQVLSELDLDTRCSLDEVSHLTLRWVAQHMIEETARHGGHADLIRETIDGTKGVWSGAEPPKS